MAVNAGREVLVQVDLNSNPGNRDWQTVAQQRGGTLGRTVETADSTHKDDNGWASQVTTRRQWTIEADGALDVTDAAFTFLETSFNSSADVHVRVNETFAGGRTHEGITIITDLSMEFPEGDIVTFTANFSGNGALTTA